MIPGLNGIALIIGIIGYQYQTLMLNFTAKTTRGRNEKI